MKIRINIEKILIKDARINNIRLEKEVHMQIQQILSKSHNIPNELNSNKISEIKIENSISNEYQISRNIASRLDKILFKD